MAERAETTATVVQKRDPPNIMSDLYLSVVIPAFNEEERLRRHLPGMIAYLTETKRPFEIIVVDDGSRDGTARVTAELARAHPMVRLIS